jgi:TPR repeat protein
MDEIDPNASKDQESFETSRIMAERGDPQAQFILGVTLANEGERPDYLQAAEWYLKAAEQGHALAQFNLGIMYGRGQGVPRDKATGMMWLGRAAQLGDAGAQYELGMRQHRRSLDEKTEAARESRIEAYKWLQLASEQGYGESAIGCETVALDMTHTGVIEAKRRAAAFVPGQS